jgi:hypothetical protein
VPFSEAAALLDADALACGDDAEVAVVDEDALEQPTMAIPRTAATGTLARVRR